jgi:hypothetical protein
VRVAVETSIGLTRLIETAAISCEQPTVVAAAETVGFDPPVPEARTPMAASRLQQTEAAVQITEGDEILAEDPNHHRQRADLRGTGERMPVAAKQFPGWGTGVDLDELGVRDSR